MFCQHKISFQDYTCAAAGIAIFICDGVAAWVTVITEVCVVDLACNVTGAGAMDAIATGRGVAGKQY